MEKKIILQNWNFYSMKYKVKGALKHQIDFAMTPLKQKYYALVGGVRSGKTYSMLYRYIFLSMMRLKNNEKMKLLVVAPTYRILKKVDAPLFTEYFQAKGIHYKYDKGTNVIHVYNIIPGEIHFLTAMNPERIIGEEFSDAIIDEFDIIRKEIQEEVWINVNARLSGAKYSTCGIATTPNGYRKTHELFIEKKIGKLHRAKVTDNPYISKEYIDGLRSQYDSKVLLQYLNGEFVNINGLQAYYSFNRDVNLIKSYKPNISKPLLIGIDFNINPYCIIIAQEIDKDRVVIFDEMYLANSNTKTMIKLVKERYPNYIINAYPDLSGNQRRTSADIGITDLTILQSADWTIYGNKRLRIKDRLLIANNAFEKGLVLITENCKYLITDLERVKTDDDGKLTGNDKKLTHISDAMTYMIERVYSWMYRDLDKKE